MTNSKHRKSPDESALVWLPIASVRRWDRNPRAHPERQVQALAGLMLRVGFVNPIVIWPSADRIVSGHGRLDAVELIERGFGVVAPHSTIPNAPGPAMARVMFHEFSSEEDATAYALADNRLPELAEDDAAALAALVGTLDDDLAILAGFGEADAAAVEQIAVQTFDVDAISDAKFTIEISGPLLAQPAVMRKLRTAIEATDGVEIKVR